MWRARFAAIAGSVVVAVALTGCGAGTKPSVVATRVWAFSDGNPVRPASSYAAELAARRDELCKTSELGSGPMTLPQAIASLEGVLARAAGANALTQLAHTQVGKSAGQAETVAAAEIAKANPGGSLAALPCRPSGCAERGRAALDKRRRRRDTGVPTLPAAAEKCSRAGIREMGIDRTQRMLNNHSHALIRLGRGRGRCSARCTRRSRASPRRSTRPSAQSLRDAL